MRPFFLSHDTLSVGQYLKFVHKYKLTGLAVDCGNGDISMENPLGTSFKYRIFA